VITDDGAGGTHDDQPHELSCVDRQRPSDDEYDPVRKWQTRSIDKANDRHGREQMADEQLQVRLNELHTVIMQPRFQAGMSAWGASGSSALSSKGCAMPWVFALVRA
jgi:hypothetical protein